VFAAAKTFFTSEGILPAPESAHAVAAVIDEANLAREENKEKVILFNLSGHGHFDMHAFERCGVRN
jgi:tryptophan synthase beta chain